MEIKSLAKKIITGGSLVEALQLIGDKLLENTDQYNNYVLLISQHKDIDQKIIAGTISLSDELIVISQLRGRVVKFVDSLDENDFRVDTQESIVQDMGQSDLPIGMLLAMGRMSPTIATSRFDSWKHLLGESKDTLLAATELKNELAEKAVKKL